MRYQDLMTEATRRLPRGFRVFRMPRGTRVYHGTGASFASEHLESPCWVSTSFDVAKTFIDWHDYRPDEDDEYSEDESGKRIIEYQTRRLVRLLYVEGRHTFDEITDRFGFDMDDPHEMAEVACRLGFDGWYIEANYREGDDTMLCDASDLAPVRVHRVGDAGAPT
jgi:hypothetical protein